MARPTLLPQWLSFQKCTPYGVKPVSEKERRFEIVCIHAAAKTPDEFVQVLLKTWLGKTCEEAHDYLSLQEPMADALLHAVCVSLISGAYV